MPLVTINYPEAWRKLALPVSSGVEGHLVRWCSCLRQCTLQLQEIGTVCARALERQARHTQLQQQCTATVLLDEGGLPGVSPALRGCASATQNVQCHERSPHVMQNSLGSFTSLQHMCIELSMA